MPLKSGEQDYINSFGNSIRKRRIERGLSMQELANLAGVEISQVYRIEKGKINPKLITIIVLCKALEVSSIDLIEI